MYHLRGNGTHYEIGYKWGTILFKNNKFILDNVPFEVTNEHKEFSQECIVFYEEYFPEILEEIKGIADGQQISYDDLLAVLLSMYCILPSTYCSTFAIKNCETIIFGRNSDFLTEIEKLYMNCIYKFKNDSYSFNANTTAFVEMEDGINEHGLAIGLTSVYPTVLQPGLNAGMLLRLFLEKCKSVDEVINLLNKVTIASSQTFVVADSYGKIALIECNTKEIEVYQTDKINSFVCATNYFHTAKMKKYNNTSHDNWQAIERYENMKSVLTNNVDKYNFNLVRDILSGKYGFICQYDRNTGKDTVWSVIYDINNKELYRVEGNPSRKKFKMDIRFKDLL